MQTITINYIKVDTQHFFLLTINGKKYAEFNRSSFQEAKTLSVHSAFNYIKTLKEKDFD